MKELLVVILVGLFSVLVLSQAGGLAKLILIMVYLTGMIYLSRQRGVALSIRQLGMGLAGGFLMLLLWQVIMYVAGWGLWMGTVMVNWMNLLLWLSLGGFILVWLGSNCIDRREGWRDRLIKSMLAALWMMFFGSVGWLSFVILVLFWYLLFGNDGEKNMGLSLGFLLGYYVWQSMSNFHIISDELPAYVWFGPNLWLIVYWVFVIWRVDLFRKKI